MTQKLLTVEELAQIRDYAKKPGPHNTYTLNIQGDVKKLLDHVDELMGIAAAQASAYRSLQKVFVASHGGTLPEEKELQ